MSNKREFDGKKKVYNVIANAAKQSSEVDARLDCFVASLLAMTSSADTFLFIELTYQYCNV